MATTVTSWPAAEAAKASATEAEAELEALEYHPLEKVAAQEEAEPEVDVAITVNLSSVLAGARRPCRGMKNRKFLCGLIAYRYIHLRRDFPRT